MATLKVTNIKNESFAGDQLYLKTDGKIGIGTTAPDQMLHIKGDTPYIKFEDDNDNQDWQIEGRAFFSIYDVNDSAHRLVIDGDGKIGIGTTSPDSTFEVSKNAEGEYLKIGGDNASNGRALKFTSSATSNSVNGGKHVINASSGHGELALATTGTERIFMKADGTVGIGTTSPAVTLEVEKTIDVAWSAANSIVVANNLLRLENPSTNNSAFAGMQFRTGDGGDAHFGSYQNSSSANDCTFYWSNQTDSGAKTLATLDTASGDLTLNDGDLVIGTSGHGIDFSATSDGSGTSESEILTDYEEGYWIATCSDGVTLHSGNDKCTYVKIGRIVHVAGEVRVNDANGGSDFKISNLPFTTSSQGEGSGFLVGTCSLYDWGLASGYYRPLFNVSPNTTIMIFRQSKETGNAIGLDASGNGYMTFNFTYKSA